MAQYALPTSDIQKFGSPTEGAGNADANAWDEFDEGFGAGRGTGSGPDDTTYWDLGASTGAFITFGCSSVTDPVSSSGHWLRVRARKSAAAGQQNDLIIYISGTNNFTTDLAATITFANIDEVWRTYEYNLTSGEANAISSYSNIALKFLKNEVGGGSGRTVPASAIEFECPDAAGGGALTINVAADSLANYGEALGLAYIKLTDSLGLYADAAPTIDKRDVFITKNVPADSLGLYADQTPTIDKQDLGLTAITRNVAADSLNNWAERLGLGISLSGDSMAMGDLAAVAARYRLGWQDATAYDRQALGAPTAITRDVPADSLGLYADQTPLIDERGILTAAPAADSLGLYADATPTVDERGFLTVAPSADSLGLYADQAPIIDRRGFLTAAPAADSLGLYADATPTISKIAFITTNVAADSLGLYADQAPVIDKQVISTTPISRDVPADSLGLYADQQPTFYETGAYSIAPSADSLGLYTDATPLIDERGFLSVAPPADSLVNYAEQLGLAYLNLTDSLGLYADAAPAIDKRGYLTAAVPTDSLGLYADQTPIVDKQTIATTPITRDVPADSLGLYADQTPTIDERGYLTAAPGADSLGLYADAAPIKARYRVGWQDQITVDKQIPNQIAVPVPADSLGLYADATPPLRIGYRAGYPLWLVDEGGNYLVDENGNPFVIAGLVDTLNGFGDSATIFRQSLVTLISVSVPADSLGLYADQAPGASKIGNLIANVAADSLGLYADQTPAFSKTGALAVNVPADSLGLYADQTPVLDKRGILSVAPAADSLANYAERLGLGLSVGTDDFNQWLDTCGASTTGLLPKLFNIPADALDNYGEQFGLGLELRGDLMTMADQAPAIVKTTLKTAAPTADAMSMGDQAAAFTVGKSYVLPTEGLPTYSEILARSVGLLIGLSDAKPIHLDSAAASEFGFIVAQFIDQNEGYADAAAVLYLGFDELAAMVTDPLANWADALAVIRNVNALKLSGKIVDSVALSGKVIEEKVSLNGKVFDTSDLSGELYTGD